jgi:hypothetical protein
MDQATGADSVRFVVHISSSACPNSFIYINIKIINGEDRVKPVYNNGLEEVLM